MTNAYWLKQAADKPLFPELLWDKPESKLHAGKLLIIGGNAHSFAAPATAYGSAIRAGAGAIKALLPDALKKAVGPALENCEFSPSTKSGSFSKQSLAEWLEIAAWSDGVLLPGDLGRNSETAIVLERFFEQYSGHVTITQDALDYFTNTPLKILERENTTIVASFAQLQRLAVHAHFTQAFTFDMPIINMVEALHLLTTIYPAAIIIKHNHTFFVSHCGEVATTKVAPNENFWRVATAAVASVWALQNPNKIFAALTTGIFELSS